jgi:HEAT repeat protein
MPASDHAIRQLNHSDATVRLQAAAALAQKREKAAPVVAALVEALNDENLHVRKLAALALGDVGPAAQSAIPALVNTLLHDHEASVRRRAAIALGEIGAEEAIPALLQASQDSNETVRRVAASVLKEIQQTQRAAKAA